MREKHLKRINKLILLGHYSSTSCIFIESIGQLVVMKESNPGTILVLIIELLVAVGALGFYKKHSNSVYFSRYIMISFSVIYTILMLTASSDTLFPYMIPYLLCSVLVMDSFSVKLTGYVFLVVNLIRIVMTCIAAERFIYVMEPVTVEFVTVALLFFASLRGLVHMNTFFNESMDEVLTASKRNETIAKTITEVAKAVEEQAEVMARDLEVIADATTTISESMNNISAGTTSSTEAIMHQTMQTQDIQKIIDETGRGFAVVANEIRKLAEQTRKETENITLLIDALSQNAQLLTDKVDQNVEVAEIESQAAQEASLRFEEISEKTKEPVKHIKEVDEMTNTLALSNNAIVDSVNMLSATSEEISASTQEADATSVKNVELVRNFSKSMDHILEQIETLQQYSKYCKHVVAP